MFAVPDLLYARMFRAPAKTGTDSARNQDRQWTLDGVCNETDDDSASAAAGVALLAGSACSERIPQPSPVRAACAGTRMNTPILRMQR